ncbi:MAG: hypothetical protein JWO02_108 [Solirubrobacterales bacterium]|nr:hypothetical protein [Solirubrobacterales bacterium]
MSCSRLAALVIATMAVLTASCLPASADAKPAKPRVVLAFLPVAETTPADPTAARATVLDVLAERKDLALGLSGAAQGGYLQEQALLDITQGTRTSSAAYDPRVPTPLSFFPDGQGGALMLGWPDILRRGDSAPAEIHPGALGAGIPGGVAYVGVIGRKQVEAAVAVNDREGRIAAISVGPSADVVQRTRTQLQDHRMVVVGLPTGDPGAAGLDGLIAERSADELLIVMQTPPDFRAPQLLPTGVLGLGPAEGLTSATTHQPGLVAGIDVLPTVFRYLGLKIPKDVKGQPFQVSGKRDADELQSLSARLRVIGARRFPALETILATWLAVLLVGGVVADRRGVRWALRVGGLAFCWLLSVLLLTAALAPSRSAELALISVVSFGLAMLTDALVRWPRAIFVPCAVTVAAYVVDLARGSDLIVRSLLGPNPRFGSRYYGLGNELEASLPILLLIAVAVVLHGRGRSRAGAAIFAATGLVFGAIVGSGRLGADVGGVLTIGAGTAVAVLCMLPGGVTRRALALAVATPVAALGALAVLDLTTGGNSHFTRTVLQADSSSALMDIVQRRYELAFNVLKRGLIPFATGIALLAIVYGLRYRRRVYVAINDDPAWRAAMYGSLAAAIAGTLFNDSGPLLLLFGTFVLVVVSAYVRGDPNLETRDEQPVAGLGVPLDSRDDGQPVAGIGIDSRPAG